MALEVFEVSRKEVERWFNRKSLVSANRVNATSPYIMVCMEVSYGMNYRNYWNPAGEYSDYRVMARGQYNSLEEAQAYAEQHHLKSEHVCLRSYNSDCACGFEIWHLVDEPDVADVEPLPDLLEMGRSLATVRYVGDDIVRANFKTSMRVMFELGSDDKASVPLYMNDGFDWLNLRYGISAVCSPFAWDECGFWTCTVLLQYDGPCSVGWWYEHLRWFRDIQCLDWVFYRVRYVSDFMHYVMKRYYRTPEILTGVFDCDATRRLAALVYADYYAPTAI